MFFFVEYNTIDTSNALDIHRYLMKETWYKIMFGFVIKVFIELLNVYEIGSFGSSLASNYEEPNKCVSLTNHPCQAKPILVNMNSNETFFYLFTIYYLWPEFVFQIK